MRCRRRVQRVQRTAQHWLSRGVVPFLVLWILLPPLIYIVNFPPPPPRDFSVDFPPEPACDSPGPRFETSDSGFCIGACRSDCFPRVRRLCVSRTQVVYCNKTLEDKESESILEYDGSDVKLPRCLKMPNIMRFKGERLTLPVKSNACNMEKKGLPGLSLVADQRYLPYKRPNPHHEAEKLIPALLFFQHYGQSNHTLHWFSKIDEVSDWAKGLLEVFNMQKAVNYITLPEKKNESMCFDDAVVFSAGTKLQYVPDADTNDWLRHKVLQHCSIPIVNASWPPKKAAILDRISGSRRLQNKEKVAQILSEELKIDVRQGFSGVGSFCNQVREVAEEDLIVVPHGSQNVNMLFARKGAVIIEIFPFLYYTPALRNYTHAAQLHLYPLLGTIPRNNILLHFMSIIGWDLCFEKVHWCKNYSRNQFVYADIRELKKLVIRIRKDGIMWSTATNFEPSENG